MTVNNTEELLMQAFRTTASSKTFNIPAHLDNKTGKHIVLWREIHQVFKNAEYIAHEGSLVPFLSDDNFEEIIPKRISYIPGAILDVFVYNSDDLPDSHSLISGEGFSFSSRSGSESFSTSRNGEAKIIAAHHHLNQHLPLGKLKQYYSGELLVDSDSRLVESLIIKDIEPSTNYNDSNNNLVLHTNPPNIITEIQSSFNNYQHLCNSFSQAFMAGHMNKAIAIADQANGLKNTMSEQFGDINVDLSENKTLQKQVLYMQQQMDESQKQMMEIQQKLEHKQQEMTRIQRQSLDQLAIIQNCVKSVIGQSYELHEHPIPRLFIVLPKPAPIPPSRSHEDHPEQLSAQQFRLYFLCECGKHTMSEHTTVHHAIHLANHEGYEIENPSEFFDKYGLYILTLMQMFKYGITTNNIIVPALTSLQEVPGIDSIKDNINVETKTIGDLVDEAIEFLESQQNHVFEVVTEASELEYDRTEALDGEDLRQLKSYLKVDGKVKGAFGNLYRIVTVEGHVKWVCLDHHREMYDEETMQELKAIVEKNNGVFTEELGKIEIYIGSKALARQFYNALVKAQGIQELDIVLGWNATMSDLQSFSSAITKANITKLTIDGTSLTGPATDFNNRFRRYNPIIELMANGRIQWIQIKNFPRFLSRVSTTLSTSSPQLRVLWIDSDIKFDEGPMVMAGILDKFPSLVELRLNDFSANNFQEFMTSEMATAVSPFLRNFTAPSTLFDCVARVADHLHTLKDLELRVTDLERDKSRVQRLLEALERHGRKLTLLAMEGYSPETWLMEVAEKFPTIQDFPMMAFLGLLFRRDEILPEPCVQWLVKFISGASKDSLLEPPPTPLSTVSFAHTIASAYSVEIPTATCGSLNSLALGTCSLRSKDWMSLIEAVIDCTEITSLYFRYSNFSLVELRFLVDCLSRRGQEEVSLQMIDLANSQVKAGSEGFQELKARLQKISPSFEICL
ncbi:hypothetical protein BGZ46_000288 [Entomortierella lignicola]|nr:hypothetical protein BGZ46_000288 [Entomortierella lignicola]